MAKQPTLPLYYNDIARTCSTWTDEEFGCYMRLLIEQWDKGSIPKEESRLHRLATSVKKNWHLIKEKFEESDGVLKNAKMEEIRERISKHKEKQKTNVQNRYQNSTKPVTKPPTNSLPLEDENEDENSHSVFCIRLLSKEGELDKEAIEVSTRVFITEELLSQFNANLKNKEIKHYHFSEYKKHLVNWIPKKPKAENNNHRNTGKQTAHDILNIGELAKAEIED